VKKLINLIKLVSGLFIYTSCNDQEKIVEINLNIGNIFYDEIKSNYQKFWIGYIKGNIEFESYGKYFVINKINYYHKINNKLVLLGSVDKVGVYNNKGTLIKKCPFKDQSIVIGLSSIMLDDPFSPIIVVNEKNEIGMINPYTVIQINFIENTLIVHDITY